MKKVRFKLTDTHQKFWQLAFIQGASLGLPVLIAGASFRTKISLGSTVTSIIFANFILWAVALAILLMTPSRKNAIHNVGKYMGKKAMYIAGLVLSFAFISWFSTQIEAALEFLGFLYYLSPSNKLKLGALLGALISIVSMGGIKLIKWITCICFPFFIFFTIYILFKTKTPLTTGKLNLLI